MTETEPGALRASARRGAANFAPILMILSFVLMIAFLAWLGLTSEGTEQVAIAEDEPGGEMADSVEMAAPMVDPDSLRLSPEAYEGQTVRVAAPMAGAVGTEAFFLELPQSPFLVKMDSALVASGRQIPQGEDDITVTGVVVAMTDSIVSAWSDAGIIGAGDRPLVEFASHFIQATRVRGGQQQGGDGGEGEGQQQDGAGQQGN